MNSSSASVIRHSGRGVGFLIGLIVLFLLLAGWIAQSQKSAQLSSPVASGVSYDQSCEDRVSWLQEQLEAAQQANQGYAQHCKAEKRTEPLRFASPDDFLCHARVGFVHEALECGSLLPLSSRELARGQQAGLWESDRKLPPSRALRAFSWRNGEPKAMKVLLKM
jgi:hypothetical protein